jgi:hypothetical protein
MYFIHSNNKITKKFVSKQIFIFMNSAKYNLKEGLEQKDRVLLLMNYSLDKTVSENKKTLIEQLPTMSKSDELKGGVAYAEKYQENEDEKEEEERVRATYDCSYPDKAIVPPKTLAGNSGILECCCYYKIPAIGEENKGQIRGMYIPKDSTIKFFEDFSDYETLSNWYLGEFKKRGFDINKDWIDEQVAETFPLGTVKRITNSDGNSYGPFVKRSKTPINGGFEKFYFIGYFTDKDRKPYPEQVIQDDRNEYQRFIDEWGGVIQWTVAGVTAIGALFSAPFTQGGSIALWAELMIEMGIGMAVGLREIEKGNDVAGWFSILFGGLPALKYFPQLKGVKSSTLNELSEAFAKSGLSSKSSPSQYFKFYKRLRPEARRALDLVIRGGDVQSASKITKNLFIQYEKGFAKMWKSSPKLFKPIEVYNRLWVRELAANLTVGLAGYLVNYFYPELNSVNDPKLTQEMKDKLDGVFENVPEELKKQMGHFIISNPEQAQSFLNDEEFKKGVENFKNITGDHENNVSQGLIKQFGAIMDTVAKKTGAEPIDISIESKTMSTKELKDQGWILLKDLNIYDSTYNKIDLINNQYWIKPIPKKSEEN